MNYKRQGGKNKTLSTAVTYDTQCADRMAHSSVISVAIEKPEDVDEQIDKVEVKRDDCQDPLI